MGSRISIGLDFDNTIACYDRVFPLVAKSTGMIPKQWVGNRQKVRGLLRERDGGEEDWQRLQGQVYGKWMQYATMMPGIAWFLYGCKKRDIEVNIVSHKTKFGHWDYSRTPLRQAAVKWMESQGLFGSGFGLSLDNVYFENSRENKVKRISELAVTHFVDDLLEVFLEPSFPESVARILFCPGVSSHHLPADVIGVSKWESISRYLLGPETVEDVIFVARQITGNNGISKCVELAKGRNSVVYQISRNVGSPLVLKRYPIKTVDERDRLEVEYNACRFLHRHKIRLVPEPNMKDRQTNVGIYEFVSGEKIFLPSENDLYQALAFLQKLLEMKTLEGADDLPLASEACLNADDLFCQIDERRQRLKDISYRYPNLRKHIVFTIDPLCQRVRNWCENYWPSEIEFHEDLDPEYRTLSPSDFGFHNALRERDGTIRFLDLEYFGWDDPAKLVSDFWWHPGMQLKENLKQVWLYQGARMFAKDRSFLARLNAVHPVFGVRWALIVLREYLSSSTDSPRQNQAQLTMQLGKSVQLCHLVDDWVRNERRIQ